MKRNIKNYQNIHGSDSNQRIKQNKETSLSQGNEVTVMIKHVVSTHCILYVCTVFLLNFIAATTTTTTRKKEKKKKLTSVIRDPGTCLFIRCEKKLCISLP